MDKVGRVVIPKRLRTAYGIGPDSKLNIVEDGTALRLEPIAQERRLEERDGFLVILPPDTGHEPVTDEMVRDLRDTLQR